MAQPQSKKQQQKNLEQLRTTESKNPIPAKFRLPAGIIAILVVLLLFFGKVLGPNKTFQAGDIIASESILPYLEAAKTAGQNVPQWIPNIFGGMPSFASSLSTGDRTYDLTYTVYNGLRLGARDMGGDGMLMLFHYFLFGVGVLLFLRIARGTSYTAALFGAFAAVLSTWFLTYAMIGHNTKVFAIALFPYILLCLEKLRDSDKSWKELLGWGGGLALAVHLLLESTHVQMIFYIALCVVIYFVVGLIGDLMRKRNMAPILRTGVIALVAAGLAFAMSADRYMATLSYAPYSIRGTPPLVERGTSDSAPVLNTNKASGLDWEYATAYSFSPGEMITFLVPGWFGFGKLPYSGPGVPEGTRIVTYFGQMLTTDAANYMGTIVFFLALVAIFTLWKRDRLVPALAVMSLFGLLLSFGDNFSLLYKPMFNLFPGFNSFRAPMMALAMMQLAFPLLAALAFDKLLRGTNGDEHDRAKIRKGLTYAFYVAAGLTIVFLVGRGAIASAVNDNLDKSGKQVAQYPELRQLAVDTAQNDAFVCLLIAAVALGAIWWFVRNKKAVPAFVGGLVVVLSLIDLWRVGVRPFEVTTKADQTSLLRGHDYVSFIQKDPSLYRVLDFNDLVSNVPVAWGMQTIAGYHAAKIRRFQDVVDVTGHYNGNAIWNPFMWKLLNVKYIISNGAVDSVQGRQQPVFISQEPTAPTEDGKPGAKTIVWENTEVLPRAFFVNRYEVKPPLEILELMRDGKFDPREVLYFDEQPQGIGAVANAPVNDSAESVTITKYENEVVEMKTNASGERLVFFSDTWYPYWAATLDGNTSLPIYRANYAFRAIKVPAGEHTVRFEYHDPKYEAGRTMSMIANIIVVIALVGGIALTFQQKKQPPENV